MDDKAKQTATSNQGSFETDIAGREISLSFEKFLSIAGPYRQNIVFADADHRRAHGIDRTLASENTMKALAEAGYTRMFRETKLEALASMKAYEHGHIGKDKLAEEIKGMDTISSWQEDPAAHVRNGLAPVIEQAKRFGISVEPVDYEDTHQIRMSLSDVFERERKLGSLDLSAEETRDLISDYERPGQEQAKSSIMNSAARNMRMNRDYETAIYINDSAWGEKAAVIFGSGHIAHKQGLHRNLEGGAVTVLMLPDREHYSNVMAIYKSKSGAETKYDLDGPNTPDFVYVVGEGRLFATKATPPDLLQQLHESAKAEPARTAPERALETRPAESALPPKF